MAWDIYADDFLQAYEIAAGKLVDGYEGEVDEIQSISLDKSGSVIGTDVFYRKMAGIDG